jgi:ubiquinone/menaquinone biosynthesis C-methylase UbiE
VLDIGYDQEDVLIPTARRLPRGHITRIDTWQACGRIGDRQVVVERSEGLEDRIEYVNADVRDLPLPSESFDVVLSNLALHSIHSYDERARVLHEVARVLRPGGQIRIVDVQADLYVFTLQCAGCVDIETCRLGWQTWHGFPVHRMILVSGKKRQAAITS